MLDHMETVTLGGKEYPIKCDIDVLIEIQEKFDGLNDFEMLVCGFRVVRAPDGSVVMDGKGAPRLEITEPSLRAIRGALPYMLREAAVALKETDPVDLSGADEAIRKVQFDLTDVSKAMHREFSKCFERKNGSSVRSREPKQK